MIKVSGKRLLECFGEIADSKRDSEEIEGIPGLYRTSQYFGLKAHKCESGGEEWSSTRTQAKKATKKKPQ